MSRRVILVLLALRIADVSDASYAVEATPRKLVRFGFVEVTNLAKPDAAPVCDLEIRSLSDREIRLTFTFVGGGSGSYERIDLSRASSGAR